jgi:hypothetical protein
MFVYLKPAGSGVARGSVKCGLFTIVDHRPEAWSEQQATVG